VGRLNSVSIFSFILIKKKKSDTVKENESLIENGERTAGKCSFVVRSRDSAINL
jgi:hypothetical protein